MNEPRTIGKAHVRHTIHVSLIWCVRGRVSAIASIPSRHISDFLLKEFILISRDPPASVPLLLFNEATYYQWNLVNFFIVYLSL